MTSNEHALKYLGTGDDYTSDPASVLSSLSSISDPLVCRSGGHKRAERQPGHSRLSALSLPVAAPEKPNPADAHTQTVISRTPQPVYTRPAREGWKSRRRVKLRQHRGRGARVGFRFSEVGGGNLSPLDLWGTFAGRKNKTLPFGYRDDGRQKEVVVERALEKSEGADVCPDVGAAAA